MVPEALLGAVSCGRCGYGRAEEGVCAACRAPWVPAAPATVDLRGPAPLHGVVRVPRGRRVLALPVDLALPVVLVGLAVADATGPSPGVVPAPLLVAVAVLLVGLTAAALCGWGRSPGRWLLGQRTVDDLTGTPVGFARLARRLLGTGRADLVTADLRRGRDPVAPSPAAPAAAGGSVSPRPAAPTVAPTALPPAVHAARPSIAIELEGGGRHEVVDALLVGRSPVDPTAADRPLLSWPDLSRRLAKTHLLLEWSGQVLQVTDLGSATGTTVVTAADGRQPLVPGVAVSVPPGATIVCGGRSIRVVPHG